MARSAGLRTKFDRAWVRRIAAPLLLVLWSLLPAVAQGQTATVSAHVVVVRAVGGKQQNAGVVVWLSPLRGEFSPYSVAENDLKPARLAQKNKNFEPHLLVVRTGSVVEFPNLDPLFHNVFSLFEGKRFDLGLYEAGTSKKVRFDRPGISYIFCNIHPQMSAVVISLDTPYYAVSSHDGNVAIPNVPAGRYVLQVWHEGSSPAALKAPKREIVVSGSQTSAGLLRVVEDEMPVAHKNKYGREYDESPASGTYPQP